jgi:hypothetical protein
MLSCTNSSLNQNGRRIIDPRSILDLGDVAPIASAIPGYQRALRAGNFALSNLALRRRAPLAGRRYQPEYLQPFAQTRPQTRHPKNGAAREIGRGPQTYEVHSFNFHLETMIRSLERTAAQAPIAGNFEKELGARI